MMNRETGASGRGGSADEPDDARGLPDDEIRDIAAQLIQEVRAVPPASPSAEMSARHRELSPADEDRVEDALVALGAADPEDTSRAEREAEGNAAQLREAVAATRFSFLQAELLTGNTMLDTADGTQQESVRRRRRGLAQEAHDVVARHLSSGADLGLTLPERDEVSAGLAHLKARLDADS
jgi:hypothetical protein